MNEDRNKANRQNQNQRQSQNQRQKNSERVNYAKPKQKSKEKIYLSVVIPLYNEEDSLPELSLQLEKELPKVKGVNNKNYEIIFVDDGSTDGSFEVIRQIKKRNPNVRAIRFRRNYGKSAALAVGFNAARGAIIATMDADLQDDPAEIKNLIAKLGEGYDLVSGWKKHRKDPLSKTLPSKFFNFVTSTISGLKLRDFNCGLKVYRREAAKSLDIYGEMHRYLPVLSHWSGFKVGEVPVVHRPRLYGKSKFGFSRFMKGYLDLITVWFTNRYLKRPLHFFGTIGTVFAIVGFALDLYLTLQWFFGKTYLTNRPLVFFGVALIIVGVQLISLGLIGELIVKNSLKKLNYSIKETL